MWLKFHPLDCFLADIFGRKIRQLLPKKRARHDERKRIFQDAVCIYDEEEGLTCSGCSRKLPRLPLPAPQPVFI